ncbi:NlpC/P60 family protein [Fructilactobacillus frigidiflavus]|uniref:NlpC/P60 family protein n=1 Tax=Fructilactobacillus frigidiflavus TaxID=3242688 RepID=UPI0037571FA7
MDFNASEKKRFKLYKAGKTWVVAATVFFALAGMSGLAVHADSTQTTNPASNQTAVATTPAEPAATTSTDAQPAQAETKDDKTVATDHETDTQAPKTENHDNQPASENKEATSTKAEVATDKQSHTDLADNQVVTHSKVSDATKTDNTTPAESKTDTKNDKQNAPATKSDDNDQTQVLAAVPTSGWNADHTQYTQDGKLVTGVQKIDGTYYDFDSNHNLVKDDYVQSQWGDWYMFGNDGKIATKVTPWAGTYYYFDPVTYLKVTNDYVPAQWGDYYMFGDDGRIVSGVTPWAGTYYDFDPVTYLKVTNDYVKSQWGDWYMFGDDGRIVSGVTPWEGTYYDFDPVTYLKVTNDYVQSQWGDWYLFGDDGKIVSGLADWAGSTYYFDPSSYLKVTNTVKNVNGYYYYFDNSGRLMSWAQNPFDLTADAKATLAIQTAAQFLGQSYVQGGNTPQTGFDCSGLVQYAYGVAGVQLPRLSEQQYYAATPINASEARRGDLVFFSQTYDDGSNYNINNMTQVGIYLGNGKMLDAQGNGIVVENVSDFGNTYPTFYARVLNF